MALGVMAGPDLCKGGGDIHGCNSGARRFDEPHDKPPSAASFLGY